jgi:hypothetical protein
MNFNPLPSSALEFAWRSSRVEEWFYRFEFAAVGALVVLAILSVGDDCAAFVPWWAWVSLVLVVAFLGGAGSHICAIVVGLGKIRRLR